MNALFKSYMYNVCIYYVVSLLVTDIHTYVILLPSGVFKYETYPDVIVDLHSISSLWKQEVG